MTRERKSVLGWALYDWANSAFATTVMAGFFPIFFKEYWSRGADVNTSTAMLGIGNSLASLAVAVLSPILGAIADQGSVRKRFLAGFAYLGALMTAGLALVGQGHWALAIVVYAGGVIGFGGANVFYDALLPGIADESRIDYVSGLGYAFGYLGGGLLFLVNVLMTLMPATFGFADAGQAVRASFVSRGRLVGRLHDPDAPVGTRGAAAAAGGRRGDRRRRVPAAPGHLPPPARAPDRRPLPARLLVLHRRRRHHHPHGRRLRHVARLLVEGPHRRAPAGAVRRLPRGDRVRQARPEVGPAPLHLRRPRGVRPGHAVGHADDGALRVLRAGRRHRPGAGGRAGAQPLLLHAAHPRRGRRPSTSASTTCSASSRSCSAPRSWGWSG